MTEPTLAGELAALAEKARDRTARLLYRMRAREEITQLVLMNDAAIIAALAANDEAARLQRRWALVEQLRCSEGHSVEIIHDNAEFGGPNCAIRTTTNHGEDYETFFGETVDDCLEDAARAALNATVDGGGK